MISKAADLSTVLRMELYVRCISVKTPVTAHLWACLSIPAVARRCAAGRLSFFRAALIPSSTVSRANSFLVAIVPTFFTDWVSSLPPFAGGKRSPATSRAVSRPASTNSPAVGSLPCASFRAIM